MCHECGDEYEDNTLNDMSPDELNEFAYYASDRMREVIEVAESHGILYELITEWSNARIVQFEIAALMGSSSINDQNW